jgi:hypothetical protein
LTGTHREHEEEAMTTAEQIRDEAIELARSGAETEDAVVALLEHADRRIPMVMAKRQLEERSFEPAAAAALRLVDEALTRGGWAE